MKRIIKRVDSTILVEQLNYETQSQRPRIRELLISEQYRFCAYTEERATAGFARDIEHFNPTLKGTNEDSYDNWFMASARWNQRKNTKWEDYLPVLYPTASDFEERVILSGFNYEAARKDDEAADNLCKLLQLNDYEIVSDRDAYLQAQKDLIKELGSEENLYNYLCRNPSQIKYRRLLETHFNFYFPLEIFR
jgi:hypothetical protein